MKQSVKLIVGNWKMNGLAASLTDPVATLAKALGEDPTTCRVVLCPPATLVERLARALDGQAIEVGGQDCRAEVTGAFTGGVAAEMLVDAGAGLVILGHSERRQELGETDALVRAKTQAALRAGLVPIVCVGETLEQREAGLAVAVVKAQVSASLPNDVAGHDFAVAYEPVWAIGSGLTPTLDQIAEVHAALRAALVEHIGESGRTAPVLYGGSVNAANARDILAVSEVGGALVGGASLKADAFLAIIRAGEPARVAASAQG